MATSVPNAYFDDRSRDDLATLADLVNLRRQAGAFLARPREDRERLLWQLGVSPDDADRVITILEEFREIEVGEPGVFAPPGDPCDLGWQTSIRAPVFHGRQDYDAASGAPGRLRIYYPST